MLKSIKTLTTLAAIGMTLYTVHCMLRLIPAVRHAVHSLLPTATVYDDAYYGAWFGLLMAVVIMTILIMLNRGKQEPAMPDKPYRVMTYVTTFIAVYGLIIGHSVCIHSTYYLYIPEVILIPLLLSATAWLWLMTRQPGIGRISKALRVASIIGIIGLCIPVLLMLIFAVYYCFTGNLILLHSWAISSWTEITIPTFLLTWYSIEQRIYNQQMRIKEPKSAAKIKITAPKVATNPWVEVVKKEAEQKLSNVEAVQNRVKRLLGLGYPVWNDSLQKCDLLEVKLWDPDYSTANVTICCNRLLDHFGHAGTIVIDTEVSCISWRNIEYQSCGFELIHIEHKPDDGGASKALFYLRVKRNRETLFIPKGNLNQDNGFSWRMRQNEIKQLTYPDYQLPPDVITNYRPVEPHFYVPGYQYILSFTVTGEFNLEAYFVPDKADVHIPIYGGGFCCK